MSVLAERKVSSRTGTGKAGTAYLDSMRLWTQLLVVCGTLAGVNAGAAQSNPRTVVAGNRAPTQRMSESNVPLIVNGLHLSDFTGMRVRHSAPGSITSSRGRSPRA